MPLAYVWGNRAHEREVTASLNSKPGWDSVLGLLAPKPESFLPAAPCLPDALFMAHYLPPAVAQMPPARAVTSLRPLERTKGSSLSLIFSPSSSSFAASLGLSRLLGCGTAGPLFPPRRAVSSLPSQSMLSPSSWLFEQSRGSQHSPRSPSPYHSPSLSCQFVCAWVDVVCMCMCVMRGGHEYMFYMGWARGMGLSAHS